VKKPLRISRKRLKVGGTQLGSWLTDWMNEWMTGWLNDLLIDWLPDWMNEWRMNWMTGWLNEWITGWLNEWLNNWMTDWLTSSELLAAYNPDHWRTFFWQCFIFTFFQGVRYLASSEKVVWNRMIREMTMTGFGRRLSKTTSWYYPGIIPVFWGGNMYKRKYKRNFSKDPVIWPRYKRSHI
jgi:hypothetical protein